MKRRIVASALLLSMMASGVTAYGVDISKSKEKLNQTTQEKLEIEKKLDEKSKEVDKMMKEIEEIDSQMRVAADELDKAKSELEKTKAEVSAVKKELEEAEKKLKEKQELFNSRVSVMYKNSSAGYLEVMLSSEDIMDLFNRLSMIKDIVNYDAEIISQIKVQKDLITEKSKELEVKQAEAVEATKKAEAKKTELADISDSKIAYMGTLKNDEMAFKRSIERLEAESGKIIQDIRGEENRIAEEVRKAEEAKRASEARKTPTTNVSNTSKAPSTSPGTRGDSDVQPQAPSYSSSSGMIRPTSAGRVSSEFGPRWGTMHKGIDLAVSSGTPIMASADGVVARSYYSSSYGEVVYINHGGGMITIYAHNSRRLVSEGQTVSKGQVIAYSGNTGDSTGPHLHFEVVVNGAKVNPRNYVNF